MASRGKGAVSKWWWVVAVLVALPAVPAIVFINSDMYEDMQYMKTPKFEIGEHRGAALCGSCHRRIYAEWRDHSRHAVATTNANFLDTRNYVEDNLFLKAFMGEESCYACHGIKGRLDQQPERRFVRRGPEHAGRVVVQRRHRAPRRDAIRQGRAGHRTGRLEARPRRRRRTEVRQNVLPVRFRSRGVAAFADDCRELLDRADGAIGNCPRSLGHGFAQRSSSQKNRFGRPAAWDIDDGLH